MTLRVMGEPLLIMRDQAGDVHACANESRLADPHNGFFISLS